MHADLAPGSLEAAAVAVRYVSGMTDRYALGARCRAARLAPRRPAPRRVSGRVSRLREPIACNAMGILDDDVARVREATDLVALVSEHVALNASVVRFQGLCPFHQEKTPSFSVSPDKGVWHCFGCQKSGDAITFVREVEHLDFVETIERLAGRGQHHVALRRRVVLGGTQAQAAAARSGAGRDRVLPPAAARIVRGGPRAALPPQPRFRRRRGAQVLARLGARGLRPAELAPAEGEVRRARTSPTPGSRS